MRKTITVGLAFALCVGVGSSAIGQESKPQVSQEAKDKWQSLTPEQKEAVEAMKKKWDSLTQDQKDALKEKVRERQTK